MMLRNFISTYANKIIKIDKNAYKFQNEIWNCAEMIYKN